MLQEAETSLIVLEEDDPPTVCRMLTYLYTLDYDDDGPPASAEHYMANGTEAATSEALTTTNSPLSAEDLLKHAKMMNNVVVYAIAQKYDIKGLKELATMKFLELLWLEAPNYAFPNIIGAVFDISSSTDSGLRRVAAKYCALYSTQILADDHLCGVIKDHSDLGLDMLREVSEISAQKFDCLLEKFVTLKMELAHTVKKVSRFQMSWPSRSTNCSITAFLKELKATYNNLEIKSDESAGLEKGDEGGQGDEN